MTQPFPGFEQSEEARPRERPDGRVVRVQPDITAVSGAFDYVVPSEWDTTERSEDVRVGALVRIDFNGRRTAGWVTSETTEPDPTVELRPLSKWSGHGPPGEVVDLARWAAWRWAGRVVHFLRAASPPRMIRRLPSKATIGSSPEAAADSAAGAFQDGVTMVRMAPNDSGLELAVAAASRGRALVLVPTIEQRRHTARGLRERGFTVAEYDDQWERSAVGAVTVGTRRAALAPLTPLDAVLVIDEHDSAYKEERTPAWNARDLAIERARRSDAPCVLTSPAPSLDALQISDRLLAAERSTERNGWPLVEVIDLRAQDRPGLLTEAIVPLLRGPGPIACILNRKGRARMLTCVRCDSLAACTECGGALREVDDGLRCARDGIVRPVVCAECGGTRMKHLRVGISRMAEDLTILAKRDVVEVEADTPQRDLRGDRLFVGTEALLRRIPDARVVIFLDFDQELAVPRYRAAEEAFVLLALAARRLGPRGSGGRLVIQTRRPNDVVVEAALHGDPARVARAQRDVREVFRQPPYGAWALVSGAGAASFIDALRDLESGVDCHRRDDRWRVSAPDHQTLLDALSRVDRGSERVRVEVDPLDA
ncbi:MAG: hypothetical protein ACR2P0_18610 [Acidimicrobiales bacterium]